MEKVLIYARQRGRPSVDRNVQGAADNSSIQNENSLWNVAGEVEPLVAATPQNISKINLFEKISPVQMHSMRHKNEKGLA
jgi:hypothetical protein